jgi:hypothetical protein
MVTKRNRDEQFNFELSKELRDIIARHGKAIGGLSTAAMIRVMIREYDKNHPTDEK